MYRTRQRVLNSYQHQRALHLRRHSLGNPQPLVLYATTTPSLLRGRPEPHRPGKARVMGTYVLPPVRFRPQKVRTAGQKEEEE
jgi:hypothetical protein